METDRNLLFGVLALQLDLIDSDQFSAACRAWTLRKNVPLSQILIEQGWLLPADRADVDRLLERKLKRFDGQVPSSLASVANDEVRRALSLFNDSEIQSSLAKLPEPNGHVLVSTLVPDDESRERYTLTRLHAKGGIGQVWLARDADLGREVALKELRPERAENPSAWARFLDEARITGQLEHPGIVPVYELARRPADQQPFYTMRFVKGRTLGEAISAFHLKAKEGQINPLDRLQLLNAFVGACNAVAYAHSRGVVHRDLKGQNIVLGDYGEAVVLDWGLAKRLGASDLTSDLPPVQVQSGSDRDPTIEGQALGTPAYMPPEQAAGRADLIDERSDVYGLGAILYEILTGRPPFTGSSTDEVLRKVREEEPALPRSLCPSAPPALEAVCLKAMAKPRENRYQSASQLAREVQRWMADEPVDAWREPWRVRSRRWRAKHRSLVAAGVAGLLVAVATLGANSIALQAANDRERKANVKANDQLEIAEYQKRIAQEKTDLAKEESKRAQRSYQLAHGALDSLFYDVLESPLIKEPGLQPLRYQLLRRLLDFNKNLVEQDKNDYASQYDLAQAYERLGVITAAIGSKQEAIGWFRKNIELIDQLKEIYPQSPVDCPYHQLQAHCYDKLGIVLGEVGQADSGIEAHRKAMAMWQDMVKVEQRDPNALTPAEKSFEPRLRLAKSYNNIAVLQYQTGRLDDSVHAFEQAHRLFRELAHDYPENLEYQSTLGASYGNLGDAQRRTGQWDDALKSLKQARDILEPLVRQNPKDGQSPVYLAEACRNQAALLRRTDAHAEAITSYRRAVEVLTKVSIASPSVTQYRSDLARCHIQMASLAITENRLEDARESLRQARGLISALIKADPSVPEYRRLSAAVADTEGLLGHREGRLNEALAACDQAREELVGLVGANPSLIDLQEDLAQAETHIGELARELGHTTTAKRNLDQARTILERLGAANSLAIDYRSELARTYYQLGLLRRTDGETAEAFHFHEKARALRSELPDTSPDALIDLACSLAQCLETSEAVSSDRQGTQVQYQTKALEALARAIKARVSDPDRLRLDKGLDPLRSSPAFHDLLQQLGKSAQGPSQT